ncbi:LexA family protein [Raoultibacter timonensis]|uniref:LexA family protein n=1 Tax=Raoultibacter timonensis TaxID=1907662 RepID=UPI001FCB7A58|nr:LexA family transcriptional regulator [Raoultibacter timonensis]
MGDKKYPNRVKELREANGISQARLAQLVDVSDTSIQNYEYEIRDIPGEVLAKMAEVFGTSSDYILMQTDNPSRIEYSLMSLDQEDGYVDVPIYGEIAAGTPIEMLEFEDEFPVPTKVKNQHPHSGLLRVKGDSYNRRLPNGCLALVDFDMKEPNEHDPFAVCVNGYSATVKRVKRLANGFELIPNSYDPTYIPTVFDYNKHDTEEITIIGQVVWATMPFDYEI